MKRQDRLHEHTKSSALRRIPAREVANRLGVGLATLSRWRRDRKPPHGWMYVSRTLVVYDVAEVEKFERDCVHRDRSGNVGGDEEENP